MAPRLFLSLAFVVFVALPSSAERGLTIDDAVLNGVSARALTVRPGDRILGTVKVSTSSSSLFKMHTGVWLPSWERENRAAMRTFVRSLFGGVPDIQINIDLTAPAQVGTYYLLFSFDRKDDDEMWAEIRSRSDDQIFANGRAVRIIVDANAAPAVQPRSRDAATLVALDGAGIEGAAGYGENNGYWIKVRTGDATISRNMALRFKMTGHDPLVDLDIEIVDEAGRRRGFSSQEGSLEEVSVVRSPSDEMLYARVYAFKAGGDGRFNLTVSRVALSNAITDPSKGSAKRIADGYKGRGRGGLGVEKSAWYAVSLAKDGTVGATLRGVNPSAELDVWIYDDLGNIRAQSRMQGSTEEAALVSPAEPGTWYIRSGALHSSDQSDFDITVYLNRPAPADDAPAPFAAPPSAGSAADTLPVAFTVARGKDFEGYIEVTTESEFLVEVFTGWGDLGVLDAITVYAPDGTVLWNVPAKGRGWEASRLSAKGAGSYRIVVTYTGEGERHGRLDVSGIKSRILHRQKQSAASSAGLDEREKKILKKLYEVMLSSGGEITEQEHELLHEIEEAFKER